MKAASRARAQQIREQIKTARTSKDVNAIMDAMESFFDFFCEHEHTFDEPGSDCFGSYERTTNEPC